MEVRVGEGDGRGGDSVQQAGFKDLGRKKDMWIYGQGDFQKASDDLGFKGSPGLWKLWLWSNETGTDKLSRYV